MSNQVVVRLFAGAREKIGAETIEVLLRTPASVGELKRAMATQHESLRSLMEYSRIAFDNEFLLDAGMIPATHARSVIALIPPVSGG